MVNAVLIAREEETPRRAPPPLFEGIRRTDWLARPDAARRRLGDLLADRGAVAYCVWDAGAARIAGPQANRGARLRIGRAALIRAARRAFDGRSWAHRLSRAGARLGGGESGGPAVASQA